jgi:putative SOS response-associated peptidase YedK
VRAGAEPIQSFTIIVTQANELCQEIHERMPVILDAVDHDAWLHGNDIAIPMALLQPYPAERMTAFPVSPRVNSTKNDDPACAEPLPALLL